MTYPFCYTPHPLCRQAADEVMNYVASQPQLLADAETGKMFGVLVCQRGEQTVFLAAYSGLLGGRNDWPWFVPPIFDAQQPDGHFKRGEAAISAMNAEIAALEQSDLYRQQREAYDHAVAESQADVERAQQKARQAKLVRDLKRLHHNLDPEISAQLVAESQFLKAEVRRAKHRAADRLAEAGEALKQTDERIRLLKTERRQRSDELQRWFFEQYILRNAKGEKRCLTEFFGATLPPAGSGDCCAPKLLQAAYELNLHPLCMAEFWWGRSPVGLIRHHGHFYPACRSKCLPILPWMMEGLDVEPNPHDDDSAVEPLTIIYEDDWLCVVSKPSGMPSVRGKIGRRSVEDILRKRWHDEVNPLIVHRLDMDTSGLMVAARTKWAHEALQRQFLHQEIKKRYVAVVEGTLPLGRGRISLPLCADPDNRPLQVVDRRHGKEAVTDYEVTATDGRHSELLLWPHTGRTHQLRVHCAHTEGLSAPIVGDNLYGHSGGRLMLHAEWLMLKHPHTGEEMEWTTACGKWETVK